MAALGELSHIVIDCADTEKVAAFWCAALDVKVQLRWHQYVILEPSAPGATALAFQQVPEPKTTKNRAHIDLAVTDLAAATTAALALGATEIEDHEEGGVHIKVLADPEGNELCLVRLPTP